MDSCYYPRKGSGQGTEMTWFSLLLGVHIAAGAVALASLVWPFVSKKGGLVHRRAGWIFAASMVTVGCSAWALAILRLLDSSPQNDRGAIFLAYVGLFSNASVWMGIRSWSLRRSGRHRAATIDFAPGAILLLASIALGLFGLFSEEILMIVFALFGTSLAVAQLRFLRRPNADRSAPMLMHLNSMGNGAISALTAFFVVNVPRFGLDEYALFFWIVPGVVGGAGLSWMSMRIRSAGRARAHSDPSNHTPASSPSSTM